jgi:NlpC/P60 family putative phage cell wall peptidase
MDVLMNHTVVACARSWIGTRFRHQGRVKKTASHKGGVDCLGLLCGIAAELDLRDAQGVPLWHADETDYPHQPDVLYLQRQLKRWLKTIPLAGIMAGDVVLLRIDDSPQHLAIIGGDAGNLSLIHAYAPAHGVVEHGMNAWWSERVEAAFRIPVGV